MANVLGIVTSAPYYVKVNGLQDYRPIGAFSFLGRYRMIDFAVSNMSNSGIERIAVFVDKNPRSITEHLGTGRHYNINSKRGKVQVLFSDESNVNEIYNTDISAFLQNISQLERTTVDYVVVAPSYIVYKQDFNALIDQHIASEADVTVLYQKGVNAKERFLTGNVVTLNKQKGVTAIARNLGTVKDKPVSLDTYVIKKDKFVELVKKAAAVSSGYSLTDIINEGIAADELDVRGVQHKGYVAAITDFDSYYAANMELLNFKTASELFDAKWPIYTRTTDSCPTKYATGASVKNSMISNGCIIEGEVENCVIGRGVNIKKGAVVKNCIILAYAQVGADVHVENEVIDKWAKITRAKEVVAPEGHPGYIKRDDIL